MGKTRYNIAIKLTATLGFLVLLACDQGVDETPPEIRIVSPVNGTELSEAVIIEVNVSDNKGVASVIFMIDGDSIGVAVVKPFQFEWDTRSYSNGFHSIQCLAVDESGNETLSNAIEVSVDNALFTARFTNNWLCTNCGEGLLFVQDMAGNLIGQKSFTGNATVAIEDLGIPLADTTRLMITTIRDDGKGSIRVSTYMDVPMGESWNIKGLPGVDINSYEAVELDLANIPSHAGWSFASGWAEQTDYAGTIPNPISLRTYQSVTSTYLRLSNTPVGTKYLWVENLQAGSFDLNLNEMLATTDHNVQFPSNAQEARTRLYGYVSANNYYQGAYLMDVARFDVNTTNMRLATAPSVMSEYQTQMYYFNNNGWMHNTVYGDIPTDFDVIDADFVVNSADKNNYQITASGVFDQILSQWRYRSGETIYIWQVIGSPEIDSYRLPTLPAMATQNFPNLSRNQFLLSKTELYDYVGLSSNEEVWQTRFKTPGYFTDHVKQTMRRLKNNVVGQ